MKKLILSIVFLNLIFISACSTAPTVQVEQANVNAPNTNAANAQEVNTNLVPVKGLANDNGNANLVNPPVQANNNPNIKPVQASAPAPFDSTIATTMNKQNQFLETRTFRSDPLIQKMERLQEVKKIRLYLKNGKIVDVPYDKGMMLFTSGSPQDILNAAGIKAPSTPPAVNPGKVEESIKDAPTKEDVKKPTDER
jgi:hypothetical protein